MKILVAIKQVPERDAPLHIAAGGQWVEEASDGYVINEPDAYALEEALQLKEKHGGEVIALSAGPERVASTLRDALAKGADRAIHITTNSTTSLAASDTLGIATLLAAAIRSESPDLILTGLQSDDLGLGQTGVVVAELLGIPSATIIMQVEKSASGIKAKRELEDGWFQHVEIPLPALLTIQSGINKLRYATLMGIKKSKSKELKRIAASDLGATPAPTLTLDRLYIPAKQKKTELLTGTPEEAASELVAKLKNEARAI
jgi:electron transfer flavoprotein beta subunit